MKTLKRTTGPGRRPKRYTEAAFRRFKREWKNGLRASTFKGRFGKKVVAEVEKRIDQWEVFFGLAKAAEI